ncbi:MAG: hypothetical protein U0R19_29420 [Bryobacteraceae bacterium]
MDGAAGKWRYTERVVFRVIGLLWFAAIHGAGEPLPTKVSKFVLAQLEAKPNLSGQELAGLLPAAIGRQDREQLPFAERYPPWNPKQGEPVLWSVVYSYPQHTGVGGNRIVVESYVVEQGKARLAGRAGRELDGVSLKAERVVHYKPGLYVLIHGNVMWSSGHALPGMAVVYEIDAAGVRVVFRRKASGMLAFAPPHWDGFTVMYHDEARHQAGQNASVIEFYVVEPAGLRRVVYQRYSSPEVK